MQITIHQPEHLPWLGLFDKIRQVDLWVILDHVQYRRRYFQNRNRLLSADGPVWVTVPVQSKGRYTEPINTIAIDNSRPWSRKNWQTITRLYAAAPYFAAYAPEIEAIYRREWQLLAELNEALMRHFLGVLGIDVEIVRSSRLDCRQSKGDLILEICRQLRADSYLSGISGQDYLDLAAFAAAGVEVRLQSFHHPVYPQLHPFAPCMSILDLLFNCGPRSLEIIAGVGVERLDYLFT